MKLIEIWECDVCGQQFPGEDQCREHEEQCEPSPVTRLRQALRELLARYRIDAGEESYHDDPAAIRARQVLEQFQ